MSSLVSPDVLARFNEIASSYRERFSITSITDVSSAVTQVVPIDRILHSHFEMSKSSITPSSNDVVLPRFLLRTFPRGGEESVVALSSVGTDSIFLPTSKRIVCAFTISSFSLLSDSVALVFSTSGFAVIVDLKSEKELSARHSIGSPVKLSELLSPTQAVVVTEDNAIYFVSVLNSDGRAPLFSLKHQLVIGKSDSLGIVSQLELGADRVLAVRGEKAVLLVDLADADKPKLVFKGSVGLRPGEDGILKSLGGNFLVLHSTSSNGPSKLSLLTKQSSGYDLNPLQQKCGIGNVVDIHPITSSVILLVTRDRRVFVSQLNVQAAEITILSSVSHSLPESLPFASANIFQSTTGAGKETLSLTLKPNTVGPSMVSVDVHSVSVLRWIEIVQSLLHCDKIEEAVALLIGLKRGEVPLLLDSSENLFAQSVLKSIVSKCKRSKCSERCLRLLTTLMSVCGSFALLEAELDESQVEDWLGVVLAMVTEGNTEVISSVTSSVVTRIVQCESDSNRSTSRLDSFISILVLRNPMVVDPNFTIRIVTTLDLKFSIVLLHIHLLRDFVFPITYFIGTLGAAADEKVELFYYVYCLTRGLLGDYPCVVAESESLSDSSVESFFREEKGLIKKLVDIDFNFALNALGFSRFAQAAVADLSASLVTDELHVYYSKCAVFNSDKSMIPKSALGGGSAVHQLIARGEIDVALALLSLTGDVIGPSEFAEILRQLVAAKSVADEDVLNFVSKFNTGNLAEIVAVIEKAGRVGLAVKLLVQRKSVSAALRVLSQGITGNLVDGREALGLLKWLTKNADRLMEKAEIVRCWEGLVHMDRSEELREEICKALVGETEIARDVLKGCESVRLQSRLLSLMHAEEEILNRSAAVASLDVAQLFTHMTNQDSVKHKGIAVTASICHVCLDPISAGSSNHDVVLFSCAHVMHENCKGPHKTCPVCV